MFLRSNFLYDKIHWKVNYVEERFYIVMKGFKNKINLKLFIGTTTTKLLAFYGKYNL